MSYPIRDEGGRPISILDEGIELTDGASSFNFVGAGVTVTNVGDDITVTIGGGGTPGGADTQVQFNDAGAFGGDAGFVYNKTTNLLGLQGSIDWSSGTAITAASYQIGRDADATNQLHFNVPTGASMEWSINDVYAMGLVNNLTFRVGATQTGLGGEQFGVQAQANTTVPIQASIHATQSAPSFRIRTAGQGNLFVVEKLGALTMTPGVQTSGSPYSFKLTAPAHTTLANASLIDVDLNLGRTVQFAGGGADIDFGIGLKVSSPTYAAAAAQGLFGAITTVFNGPPIASTNISIDSMGIIYAGNLSDDCLFTASNLNASLLLARIGLETGVGAVTTLATVYGFGGFVSLGNQTATLTNLNYMRFEAVTYDSTLNVRTVTNPAGLYVEAPIADANVTFTNPALAIHAVGKVNIGTPVDTMTVNGAVISSAAAIHSTDGLTTTELELHRYSATAGAGAIVYGARSRGAAGAPTVVSSGDTLFHIYGVGYDGTDFATSSEISMEVDGTPGSNDMPGRIIFNVAPDGSQTLAEAVRISSTKVTKFSGGVTVPYVEKTANYTLTNQDFTVNTTTNSFDLTLPTAVGITGRIYQMKNSGNGTTITIKTTSAQTIDGEASGTITLTYLENLTVQSDGANWITIF